MMGSMRFNLLHTGTVVQRWRHAAALLLALTILLAAGEPAAAEPHRVLRVGWFRQGNQFLLDYVDASGVHQGLTPDTLRAVLVDSGVAPHYQHFHTLSAAEQALRKGEVDVLLDLLHTPQRQQAFWLSAAYADLPIGLVQPRTAAQADSLSGLNGLRVSLISQAWQDYLLQASPLAQPLRAGSPRDAVRTVAEGRADAYLGFYFAGLAEIEQGGYGSLGVRQLPQASRSLHFMTRRDDAATIALLSKGLRAMSPQIRNDIRVRWLDAIKDADQHALSFSAAEQAWLDAHPVLKVGIPGFSTPYDYLDDEQNWHGPGAELLRRFAVSAGIRLEPILLSRYEAPHEALRRDVVDVTPSFTAGTGGAGIVESASYTGEPWGWVRRSEDASRPLRVAAVDWRLRGVDSAVNWQRYQIVPVGSTAEALAAIVADRADAAYVNQFVANDMISQFYLGRLQVAPQLVGIEHLGLALPADHTLLLAMLNRAIASYRPGQLERLANGDRQTVLAVGYDKRQVWRTALLSAAGGAVLLLALGWTNHRIRAAGRAADLARRDAVAARQQAEAADRAKSVFLATMSHEIRTPMNGVIGVIDLLQDSVLDDHQRRYLGVAEQSARLLLRVLNDVLDYSKIEAGALTLECAPFDMYLVAAHIAVLFRPLAIEKNIGFGVAVMPHFDRMVVADALRLTQILVNLVSNAIRFTERGEVTIELRNHVRRGQRQLQLRVRDSGCGMSPAFRARLFTPFQQEGRASNAVRSGTGLGLSIVKQLTEMMGGAVAIESTQGLGTVCTVALPLVWGETLPPWPDLRGHTAHVALASAPMRRAQQAWLRKMGVARAAPEMAALRVADAGSAGWRMAAAGRPSATVYTRADFVHEAVRLLGAETPAPLAAPALTPGVAVGDVLLCDDHEINRDIMLSQLAKLGFEARSAIDGVDALDQWRQHQPRIMLADCHMPRMDGYALARAIRAEESERGLPRTLIIAVSANASKSDADACLAAGMDDYLAKPLTRQMLLHCLQRWGVYRALPQV
jgi:signal transduction histidine kinase/ActR/RegA family two-component response regulator